MNVHIQLTKIFFVLLATLSSLKVYAHSDEYFDSQPSPHGGQLRMAGMLHIELVVDKNAATIYVTDHANTPQATARGKAQITIPSLNQKVAAEPAGDNRFSATLPSPLPAGEPVVVFVQLEKGDPEVAKFGRAQEAKHEH